MTPKSARELAREILIKVNGCKQSKEDCPNKDEGFHTVERKDRPENFLETEGKNESL